MHKDVQTLTVAERHDWLSLAFLMLYMCSMLIRCQYQCPGSHASTLFLLTAIGSPAAFHSLHNPLTRHIIRHKLPIPGTAGSRSSHGGAGSGRDSGQHLHAQTGALPAAWHCLFPVRPGLQTESQRCHGHRAPRPAALPCSPVQLCRCGCPRLLTRLLCRAGLSLSDVKCQTCSLVCMQTRCSW